MEGAIIAVLLPLTSRGMPRSPRDQLKLFEECLPPASECVLFIGVDDNDPFFSQAPLDFWGEVFPEHFKAGHVVVKTFQPTTPPKICAIARTLAGHALNFKPTRCSLFVLLGDDVAITPKRTWLEPVRKSFNSLAEGLAISNVPGLSVPKGFGAVCLRDASFIGFPTFPIVGRPHLEAFDGLLSPVDFINQDADPFTFEVYRRFGAAIFASGVTLTNSIGGDEGNPARYERVPTPDWAGELLEKGVERVATMLLKNNTEESVQAAVVTTIDVIVPSYRTPEALLRRIISLQVPKGVSTQFVIIIDSTEGGDQLRRRLEADFRELVRIRVNSSNMGASQTRNRGLDESSAQWVIFLDDDIEPHPALLVEYAAAIATDGHKAAGFVGTSLFPDSSTSILATGLEMSYLTYFWGMATLDLCGSDEAPWGVTANVCTRRTPERFDIRFPKTGGGEDIDYERRVARSTGLPLLKAPRAVATHPFWNGGSPSPWRFYNWAIGDTLLMDDDLYPEHTFVSWPNVWEFSALLVVCGVATILGLVLTSKATVSRSLQLGLPCIVSGLAALWLAEVVLDMYHAMVVDTATAAHAKGLRRAHAALVACVYKNFNEAGHFAITSLRRARPFCRFDWCFGISPDHVPSALSREYGRAVVLGSTAVLGCALSDACCVPLVATLVALLVVAAVTFHASPSK